MALRETLERILTEYPTAKMAPLEGHPLAQFLRGEAETTVLAGLGALGAGLVVEGSPGQGNWAAVPWISVFDPTSLREFSAEELAFAKSFKVDELRVEAGASFLRQGTRSEYLYTVLNGWAFRYKMLDDGRRQILNYALPADMLGLQGALMNEIS